jgi:hypothetical protein
LEYTVNTWAEGVGVFQLQQQKRRDVFLWTPTW